MQIHKPQRRERSIDTLICLAINVIRKSPYIRFELTGTQLQPAWLTLTPDRAINRNVYKPSSARFSQARIYLNVC